jgi:hypothetical protein
MFLEILNIKLITFTIVKKKFGQVRLFFIGDY